MAVIQKLEVSDAEKTWISASERVRRFYYSAGTSPDKWVVDDQLLNCMIEPKMGSAGERRMVLDYFLEREAAKEKPSAVIHQLAVQTIDLLLCGSLKDAVFIVEANSEVTTHHAMNFVVFIDEAKDDHQLIHRLRQVLGTVAGPGVNWGRPCTVLTHLRAYLLDRAIAGDVEIRKFLADIRQPLRKVLGSLSLFNTLVSFIEPPMFFKN